MIRGTIRGTDARTVTDIPTGKQLPKFKVNGVRGGRGDGSRQLAADSPAISSGQAGSRINYAPLRRAQGR